jgi:hypothetical protein
VAALKQQGRVDTDADANEQRAIDLTLRQTINTDVIGQYGGPENDAGFAVTIVEDEIWFSPGRYYVNGILVENRHSLSYDHQRHLIGTATASDLLWGLRSRSGSVWSPHWTTHACWNQLCRTRTRPYACKPCGASLVP